MKRSTTIKLLAAMLGFSLAASVTGAVAWFVPAATIESGKAPIEGATEGAYFAYGDGSQAKPYGIKKPRHLYNLAWLNYLGYFNKTQMYFELDNDLSMSGWTIPPIGTTDYPFVGHFNGKNYIISDCTTSNLFTDYGTKHPGVVTSQNFDSSAVKIVGFFGVVGNYNSAYGGASYSSAVNTVSDLGLTNVTVKTTSADTLIGMVAGYADADIIDVAVDTGNVNVAAGAGTSVISPATKVSEHGIIGYTTKTKDIRKVDETIYAVNVQQKDENQKYLEFNATDQGDTTGWGGSIDMMSVMKRLQTIRNNASSVKFDFKRTYKYHKNSEGGYTKDTTYTADASMSANASNKTYIINNNDQNGHFNIICDSGYETNYALLGGGHYETSKYYDRTYKGYAISNGTNYLNINANHNGTTNGTASASATLWSFTMPTDSVASTISYAVGDNVYYLKNSNGSLSVSTSNPTTWTITKTSDSAITITSGNYYLIYSSGWRLYSGTAPYYVISDGTHYMADASRYYALSTTNKNSATHFSYDASNNRYYSLNNTSYYLGYYSSSYPVQIWDDGDYYYRLVDTSGNLDTDQHGTGYLRAYQYGTSASNYYVKWSGSDSSNPWTSASSVGSATQMTVELISPEPPSGATLVKGQEQTRFDQNNEYLSQTKTGMNYDDDDVTYFPLSTINGATDLRPADHNTAYVVAGSNITSSTTTNNYSDTLTRVRFGRFEISGNLSSDYSSGTFSHVYTVNSSMKREEITNNASYEKLPDAKKNLGSVLKSDGTYVYGLHFMDAAISMDALTTAKYVRVNKTEYLNYQLPVNSINFHLKEFGYINFMAGTYYSNSSTDRNDSFFSLYQIERLDSAPNKINRIFEVLNVYKHSSGAKNYSYVYELKDIVTGTTLFTKPYQIVDVAGNKEWIGDTTPYAKNQYVNSLPDDYQLVFNCARIKKNTISMSDFDKHAFYFEIPMNDGEFCLGSVSGATGSYLMYLDIGANAAKTQRTIISERFVYNEKTFTYPVGVAFLPYNDSGIDDTNSISLTIPTGFAGKTLTVSRTNDTISVKENDTEQLTGDLMYLGDGISIATNIQEKLKPKLQTSKEVQRVQYFDYNVNLEKVTKTIITDTYLNGAAKPTRVIEQYGLESDGTWTAVEEEDWRVFQTESGSAYDIAILSNPDRVALNSSLSGGGIGWKDPGSTVAVSFHYIMAEGVTTTETLTLTAVVDSTVLDGQYYKFGNYAFLITPAGGSVTITVLAVGSGTVTINGTTVQTVGQEIVASAS